MNDDTTKSDGWDQVETTSAGAGGSDQSKITDSAQPIGFCQDCGRPLTKETLRSVGAGVFCEPCLSARVGGSAASSGYPQNPPFTAAPPQAAATGEPSPILAAILGFIPGVGAMYNGQFAKGIVHLIIFVLLVSLSENVNGIFGLFVAGWMFYMAFEAYHTAAARRDGLPLPNAFGFNDIGERMGFGRTWGTVGPARPNSTSSPVPNTPPDANPNPNTQQVYPNAGVYQPVNQVPVGTAPDWVGYVPPTAFTAYTVPPEATAASMIGQIHAQAVRDAGVGGAPYGPTYTGGPNPYGTTVPPLMTPEPGIPARRFPSGAIWLIGLGLLILIANLLPDWKVTEQWWPPIFFAGLSVWLFTRRLHSGVRLVCIIRWPVILMVLAIMLALHAAYVPVTIGLTGSVILIVFGALLLMERTAGASPVYAPPFNPNSGAPGSVTTAEEQSPNRAAWADPDASGVKSDDPKDGA